MMKVEITYNGRKCHDLKDAFIKALSDGVKKQVQQNLAHLQSEIAACNGVVKVNIPRDMKNMGVEFSNMPEDLLERIKAALQN